MYRVILLVQTDFKFVQDWFMDHFLMVMTDSIHQKNVQRLKTLIAANLHWGEIDQ
jgi:hypothetical protein